MVPVDASFPSAGLPGNTLSAGSVELEEEKDSDDEESESSESECSSSEDEGTGAQVACSTEVKALASDPPNRKPAPPLGGKGSSSGSLQHRGGARRPAPPGGPRPLPPQRPGEVAPSGDEGPAVKTGGRGGRAYVPKSKSIEHGTNSYVSGFALGTWVSNVLFWQPLQELVCACCLVFLF